MKNLDASFQHELPGFWGAGKHTGFRLTRFEVYNWGTFHNRVWSLELGGKNALLTGDIGSGKSTFVDAITTLLVPQQKIVYNKAAGAEGRERNPKTYVLGHYKSERGSSGFSVRPVALRDQNSYSAILGCFYNQDLERHITLAQVFWVKDPQEQPARLYILADLPLSITKHLAGFGSDIKQLRRRLRDMPDVEIHDSFPPYGAAYRRRFGIDSEQAIDLFNQTTSMKSVNNLTDFVRDHMLEAFPVEPRIEALINHFNDLDRAHQAVLKAKDQIARLTPLVANCDELADRSAQVESLRNCRNALHNWFGGLKKTLLEKRLASLEADLARLAGRIESFTRQRNGSRAERDDLKKAIAENGGDRIEHIKREIAEKKKEKDDRSRRAGQYEMLAHAAGLPGAQDGEVFLANQHAISSEQQIADASQAEKQNAFTEANVDWRQLSEQHRELKAELQSLRQRRSNIPKQALDLRDELCRATGLKEETLPFVGELLQVRSEESDWEGAAERVLHNFGLSLLVPDSRYSSVADWVDRTHLGGRLVYYRVREQRMAEHLTPDPASLARKIAIKPDSSFYSWLESEIIRRFDYACCDSLDQFRRERQAITRAGQIKGNGERHEKDDRHRIDDRSRFVLGWSNEAKVAALEKQARDLEKRLESSATRIARLNSEMRALQDHLGILKQLSVFQHFHDLEWKPLVIEIERLEKEKRELQEGSDILRILGEQLTALEASLKAIEDKLEESKTQDGLAREKRREAYAQLADSEALLSATPEEEKTREFPFLEAMRYEALGERTITIESCDNREREMREWLQTAIDAEGKKIARLSEQAVQAMESYRIKYPLETQEIDASIAAVNEYRSMLEGLRSDDLPRFETRFKELLNENTIREVANFQSQLNRERETIRQRIDIINQSLREIDYNPGRYIVLEAEGSTDVEIRDFQQDLRSCTEGTLTGAHGEEYSEAKFLQVKGIIDRFRGREGSGKVDERWKYKVTDVRQWFTFSASERWREDGREFEHYTDSSGKSGGQKEKLAYTVLAASLAYQFGLEKTAHPSRSFRFVVIDEAFGRGSDESASYGLKLFKSLNLQLLIVTPLQKIQIIEPYVASVGFVHNEEGRQSMLRNLTIEEYRAEREARGV